MAPNDIVAVVADRFNEVRTRLDAQFMRADVQITRTAHLQQQLDAIQKDVAKLRDAVALSTELLHTLMNNLPWKNLHTRDDD